jgi:hypothetical protein
MASLSTRFDGSTFFPLFLCLESMLKYTRTATSSALKRGGGKGVQPGGDTGRHGKAQDAGRTVGDAQGGKAHFVDTTGLDVYWPRVDFLAADG